MTSSSDITLKPDSSTPSTDATTNLDPDPDPETGTIDTTPIPEDPAPSKDGGHTTVPSGG